MTLLSDLVTTLRQRTDTSASQFVTDPELAGYLNSSLAELDDVLIGTYEDYKVTTTTATIASSVDGSNFFMLPADFLKSRRVDRQVNGCWLQLDRFSMMESNAYAYPALSRVGFEFRYRIEGLKCWIVPWSNSAGIYQLWYVPRFTALALTDPLPSYMDQQSWTEFAIADSGAKVLQKQDLDPSIFLGQKGQQQARVVAAAATRDAGPPRRMVDTRGAHQPLYRHGSRR